METQPTASSQSVTVENVGQVSGALSSRVENLSPGIFLSGAAASVALSLFLRVTGRHHDAQFVGQWAPTLLLLGLYTREARVRGWGRRLESGDEALGREMH
jgi:hypothetical protein